MNDRLLSLLGLMRRASKLTLGTDAVIDSVNNGESRLVLLTCDASERTRENLIHICQNGGVECVVLSYDTQTVGHAVGKWAKVLSVNDSGFAKAARSHIR